MKRFAFRKISDFLPGPEISWAQKYKMLSKMGPYCSVGAHIKTGKRYMAQDHFKTPPGPQKGNDMIKNQKTKKWKIF